MKASIALAAVVAVALAGCAPSVPPTTTSTARPTPSVTPSAEPLPIVPLQPTGAVADVVTGLNAPWSIARLESGSTLISERDTALIRELAPDGTVRDVGAVPAAPQGEGGLLGILATEIDGVTWLYAYFTSAEDNRIVRYELLGDAGSYTLGAEQPILTGIGKAGNHNGGRLAIGPDGKLYATSGDAGEPGLAQDPTSLNGKILRLELDGSVPSDNPFPGSFTWSFGHRNPQGITWTPDGTMWAAEFGQNTWDEVNLIVPGANYGWPVIEGVGGNADYADPHYVWPTSEASPSGLTSVGGTLFLAGLGGRRLWVMTPGMTDPAAFFVEQFGRIRDVVPGPDGTLWMLTNNTDGRGDPVDGDDRILQLSLSPS